MDASGVTAIVTLMTDEERHWAVESLNSVLDQTVLPDRVLVMVETNNTWIGTELDRLANQKLRQELIEVYRMRLARQGAVRNTGVQRAATPWIAFLDGDDVWKPNRLETQLRSASLQRDASFISGDFEFIDVESRPFAYSNGSYPTPSAWLVRSKLLLTVPFHPTAVEGEDHDWLRKTRHMTKRVRVPEVLVSYRIRPSSVSSLHKLSTQRKIREGMARIARVPLMRSALLSFTYMRYRMNVGDAYDV